MSAPQDVVAFLSYPPRILLPGMNPELCTITPPPDAKLAAAVPWLAFLGARVRGESWFMLLGRGEQPRLTVEPPKHDDPQQERYGGRRVVNARCVLVHDGIVRGRVPIVSRHYTVEGCVYELGPLHAFVPFTLKQQRRGPAERIRWFPGARDPWWHEWPSTERRMVSGEATIGDEMGFEQYVTHGLEGAAAKEAETLAQEIKRYAPPPPSPAPVVVPKKAAPPPPPVGQRSLFG